ncbi:TPM domain-containing protein [Enterovirga rhinocerotis]|uniref:Putative membrane protein n=1 Tax=Enterovirga rhinocerotis TaxID=1339210 RepID=A0A4V3DYR3_9HYPH|nr:hypothetical protein [Enterovirga rhinocerotis]TDR93079.1 putative membrane protein [Enterovirga rhinocerotis]
MLKPSERDRIEQAVRDAESGTAGEIVVVLARQAGRYKTEPLVYALLCALIAPWPLLFLTQLSAARIFTLQATIAALVLALASLLGPLAVPPALRRLRARTAAAREFASRGMADTRGRTGILLYVALAEHYAEVVGDLTIAERVDEAEWKGVIEALVEEMASDNTVDAIAVAVERIGAILSRHVPPEADDRDELPNRVVIV